VLLKDEFRERKLLILLYDGNKLSVECDEAKLGGENLIIT
jgi:hypothetical protein